MHACGCKHSAGLGLGVHFDRGFNKLSIYVTANLKLSRIWWHKVYVRSQILECPTVVEYLSICGVAYFPKMGYSYSFECVVSVI